MNLRRAILVGALIIAGVVVALGPQAPVHADVPAQSANPAGDVQVYLESQGYTVLKVVYSDGDATAVVIMNMVSGAFDDMGKEQVVQGWYALARAYPPARDLWSAVLYQQKYIIVFQVQAQDFRDWVDGRMSAGDLHYAVQVLDATTGQPVSDKDFVRKNFVGTSGGRVQTLGSLPQLRFAGLWLLYRDDFSDPLSGWDVSQGAGGSAGYAGGAYRVTLSVPNNAYWSAAPGRVREFAFSAKAYQASGDERNPYGLIFGYQDNDNFYTFMVTAQGNYAVLQKTAGTFRQLQPWTASSVLKQGRLPNLLRVEVQGEEARVFANGQVLTATPVPGFERGQVGLVAATYDQPPTEVYFDDVALFGVQMDWRVEAATTETHQVQPLRREAVPAAAQQTLQALAALDPPSKDLYDLAVRLGEVSPGTARTLGQAPQYAVGDTETLYASRGNDNVALECELVYVTPGVYAWVEKGQPYKQSTIKTVTDLFYETIAPLDRSFFGSEWTPGVDNDPRIHILNFNATQPGLAGYFQPNNEFPRTVVQDSNQREMVFMNALGPNTIPPESDFYRSTLAHEFQHMIHWATDPNEDLWINEGCSKMAEYLNGFDAGAVEVSFSRRPDTQLNAWEYGENSIPHYGNAYLFMTYFLGRFGRDLTQAVAQSETSGIAGFDQALRSQGLAFDDVFDDWAVALYINDPALGARYAFPDGVDAVRPRLSQMVNSLPADELTDVHQYAADYIKLNPGLGTVQVDFTGSTVVPIGPGAAYNGQYVWWFGWGDWCDATLTREFDLRSVSRATLEATVWYDTQQGGVDKMIIMLMVSTDGGQTWTEVDSTWGRSGGGDQPSWEPVSFDLSKWAGQKVQVRFEALTNLGIAVGGLALDEISISEIGYRYDPDDGDDGWKPEGFARVVPLLPQRYTVQVIEFDGERATAVRRMVLDSANHGVITIDNLAGSRSAVLVVTAHTPYAGRWASYEYQVTAQGGL
ncbi:MAG: immune inhibitor A [Chloroflexi bacterium]|nr:immune inhibitor A [Chloroflexota bacterium]MBU1752128.1 immune inhibitor A [Chloroflexota bacterium]MBU1880049.1 immune inhibitor A [Chloroflexota bacterium]